MLILNEEKYAKSIYDGKNEEEKSILSKVGYITRYLLYVENKNGDAYWKEVVMNMYGYWTNKATGTYLNIKY